MKRKKFIKSLLGIGTIVALPSAAKVNSSKNTDCELSPSETAGPFPIKTPAQLVRENIVSDRTGTPLVIELIVQGRTNGCSPLANVNVDVWHCDAEGHYSEYGGIRMQRADFTDRHFLRGRQKTDESGKVSFVSIYPGWYPGRAPHIHVEVLDKDDNSLRVTQIAFPEEINSTVYARNGYNGKADTLNSKDGVFRNSLKDNMADSVTGNTDDGYVLTKTLIV